MIEADAALPSYSSFREVLDRVHAVPAGEYNVCKHGEGLYECMEDCLLCFEEALKLFAEEANVRPV